jgi:hypothetical protein
MAKGEAEELRTMETKALDVGGRSVWLFLPGTLGRSYKPHIRIVPRVCTMQVGIYMAHGWTRSKWAEQREAKGQKKKLL